MSWDTLPPFLICRSEVTAEHEQPSFVLHTQKPRFLLECTEDGPGLCRLIDMATQEEAAPFYHQAFAFFSGEKLRRLLAEHSSPEINFLAKRAAELISAMSSEELLALIPTELKPGPLELAIPDPEGKSRLPKGSSSDPFARYTLFTVEAEAGTSREQLAQNVSDWCNELLEDEAAL